MSKVSLKQHIESVLNNLPKGVKTVSFDIGLYPDPELGIIVVQSSSNRVKFSIERKQ